MRSVLCSIGSMGASGRVAIPVAVFIPGAEWQALAERLSQASAATDHPALAALAAAVLPKVAEVSDLPPLREELARVAPGLLEGPATSAAALLREYLDRATQYVEAWRADGERTVGFYADAEEAKVTSEEDKYRVHWIGKAQGESLLASCLRDIFGNPFVRVSVQNFWLTSHVVTLSHTIYAGRDFDALPMLADALEDAGCPQADILGHCRQVEHHVRGCWVLDLLTGRS